MIYATLRKNPTAKLDFSINYALWLAQDITIESSDWTVPDGLDEEDDDFTDTTTTVVLSGGGSGFKIYEPVNDVVLSNTFTDTRTLRIIIPTAEYNNAYNELSSLVQASVEPILTESELNELLLGNVTASLWEASHVYSIGDTVVPTTNNKTGRRYRLVSLDGSGVTSGATEPSWPEYSYGTVSDGNLTWQEDGLEVGLWNVREAAYQGWLDKAAKASALYDARTSSGTSATKSQIYSHCLNMANRYTPIGVA
jgi:hypothetical protein